MNIAKAIKKTINIINSNPCHKDDTNMNKALNPVPPNHARYDLAAFQRDFQLKSDEYISRTLEKDHVLVLSLRDNFIFETKASIVEEDKHLRLELATRRPSLSRIEIRSNNEEAIIMKAYPHNAKIKVLNGKVSGIGATTDTIISNGMSISYLWYKRTPSFSIIDDIYHIVHLSEIISCTITSDWIR